MPNSIEFLNMYWNEFWQQIWTLQFTGYNEKALR